MKIVNKLKLLASDIDKTLIFQNDKVPQDLLNSVKEFQTKSNSKLTLVTGRNFFLTKKIAKDLQIKLPIITSNGSVVIDPKTEEIIYINYINFQKCINIIDDFENDNVDITLYSEWEMVCLQTSQWFNTFGMNSTSYEKEYRPKIISFKNYKEIKQYLQNNDIQITRILLDFKTDIQATNGFNKLDKNGLYPLLYINDEESVIEIFNQNTNKAIGLRKILSILKIKDDEIAIFGDQINDIEMFKEFKYSFVVENGIEELKQIAFQQIDSVYNNGVGKTLIKLLDFID